MLSKDLNPGEDCSYTHLKNPSDISLGFSTRKVWAKGAIGIGRRLFVHAVLISKGLLVFVQRKNTLVDER